MIIDSVKKREFHTIEDAEVDEHLPGRLLRERFVIRNEEYLMVQVLSAEKEVGMQKKKKSGRCCDTERQIDEKIAAILSKVSTRKSMRFRAQNQLAVHFSQRRRRSKNQFTLCEFLTSINRRFRRENSPFFHVDGRLPEIGGGEV